MLAAFLFTVLSLGMNANAFVCDLLKNADDWDAASRKLAAIYAPKTPEAFLSRLQILMDTNRSLRATYLKARQGPLLQVEAHHGEARVIQWIYDAWIAPFSELKLRSQEGPNPEALLLAMISEKAGGSLEPITNKILAVASRFLSEEADTIGITPLALTHEYEVSSQSGYLPVLLPGGEYAYFDVVTFSISSGGAPKNSLQLIDRLWEASIREDE